MNQHRNFERPGRSLVTSKSGMAATSHPTSTLVAVDILRAGGNAMDAAVAACAVQSVVEAGSTGIGGDCFALFCPSGLDTVIAYNGSGRSPLAATCDWYESQGIDAIPRQSPHAVTVPGAVEAWSRLIKDHGRMALSDVLAPAIELARNGYPIAPRVAYDLRSQTKLLLADPTTRSTFLRGDEAPDVGEIQRQPKLASLLESIGKEGPSAFYAGEVASDMVDYLRGLGGLHTLEDFAAAAGEYVTPISAEYHGNTVYECPPNGQGIVALMILKILSRRKLSGDPLSVDNLFVEAEATRLAYAARDQFVADMGLSEVPVDFLLSDRLADELAAKIDPKKAAGVPAPLDAFEHKDTVYIAVVDKDRNVASFINSIFHSYGAGLMSPKHGVLLHNRAQSFSLKKGHPNAIAPRKRPMHTIIPGMVARDGKAQMAFGVMGGHYQAMGHAHLLSKVFNFGLDLQTAIDLPRLFPLPGMACVEMEEELRARCGDEFVRRGLTVQAPERPIGGAQAIWIDWNNGTLVGASDHRKDGCALGY